MDAIDELLARGVANIIPGKAGLEALLRSGKQLNVYFGIDPTATKIHVGHAVPLRKLQALAQSGHNVTFLIGDFTALIGDTSDKESERPVLTSRQIEENFQTYKQQAQKLLDFSKIRVRHNSEWLGKLTFTDIVKLTYHFSAGDFYSREIIKKRLTEGARVGLQEVLYPIMQGYDSYFLDTDIQLGGTDQTFNMQAGRTLQKDLRRKESFIIANPFLDGTDGRKMSKTWNNAIWLNDPPNEIYGKVMSLKDEFIVQYFTLSTNASLEEIEGVKTALEKGESPMIWKKRLAHLMVSELHSPALADQAQEQFEKTVSNQVTYSSLPTITLPSNATVYNALQSPPLSLSKTESKRLISAGSIDINNITVNLGTANSILKDSDIIKKGKFQYFGIKIKEDA